MEFSARQVKWYWLLLFLVYSGFVLIELFNGNPYLYSHHELRSALTKGEQSEIKPFPMPSGVAPAADDITYFTRWNFQRTGVDPLSVVHGKNLVEYQHTLIDSEIENWQVIHVTTDSSGFYATGTNQWLVVVGLDGMIRWKFKFERMLNAAETLLPTLLDKRLAFAIHPAGEITALNKNSGQVEWNLNFRQELVGEPFLWKEFLIVPVLADADDASSKPGVKWLHILRTTGELKKTSEKIDIKPGYKLSFGSDLDQFIVTQDNKVLALDPQTLQSSWNQVLTDPIKDYAVISGSQIFVATLGAKVVKLDGSKKGKIDWEVDIQKPAAGSPTLLPIMNKLSVMDEGGAIYSIDAKSGKSVFRLELGNRGPFNDTWSARIKSSYIEEYSMDWLHKGWTIWASCGQKNLCIVTPNKGIMVAKIGLNGSLMNFPVDLEGKTSFFERVGEGKYAVSQLMDEKDLKKLRAEEAEATAKKAAEEAKAASKAEAEAKKAAEEATKEASPTNP